jgi:hypothetical protein
MQKSTYFIILNDWQSFENFNGMSLVFIISKEVAAGSSVVSEILSLYVRTCPFCAVVASS